MKLKALDFVVTPKGSIAMVNETHDYGNNYAKNLQKFNQCSITFISNEHNEHNAWWCSSSLKKINSLPLILAENLAHPFGNGKIDANKYFNK